MQARRALQTTALALCRPPETVGADADSHGVNIRGQPREYRFGEFVLIPALFDLRRRGRPLHVAPKVFDFILYLIENRGRVVTHAELRAQLWPGVTVTDSSLTYTVMAARRALGDEGRSQSIIRNVRTRGYGFVPALSTSASERGSALT
jgi:DNA-binding winged helix-turn-helix (wHTH) protein